MDEYVYVMKKPLLVTPMSRSSFVSYCNERGIRTSGEELERYEKLKILKPIIRTKDAYYYPFQIFKLDRIHVSLQVVLEDPNVNPTFPKWAIRPYSYANEVYGWLDKALVLLIDISKLKTECTDEVKRVLKSHLQNGASSKDAIIDSRYTLKAWQERKGPTKIKEMLKRNKLSADTVEDWMQSLIFLGQTGDPIRNMRPWLEKNMPYRLWKEEKLSALFASSVYAAAADLYWILKMYKHLEKPFDFYIHKRSFNCVICGSTIPKSQGGKRLTCGKKACVARNRNLYKKRLRIEAKG